VKQVDWFGTSMGGLIGMGVAALKDNPIRKMMLNDIGPTINYAALMRIAEYMGKEVRFPTFEAGVDYIRLIAAPFGPHSDEQWRKLAGDVLRQQKDGQWSRHYDPAIAQAFTTFTQETAAQSEAALWAIYDAIHCPVLLVRGSESDLLSRETADLMTQRGPRARLTELAGIGHAPTFMQPEQITLARQFFIA
jgi:pimeloyl-ACP methyl ester carboxylesterase